MRLVLLKLHTLLANKRGQTMAEYGILLAVILLVVLVASVVLGGNVSSAFSSTGHQV